MTRASTSRGLIVAGASLNFDRDEKTLRQAQALAQRLNMRLRLVHALDWMTEPWVSYLPGDLVSIEVTAKAEELARKDALSRLQEVARGLETNAPIEVNVVHGPAALGILADAHAANAQLIVAGATSLSHRFTLRGISTAISLMAESSIPVMIFPEDKGFDFSKPNMRLVLADDLKDESETALKTGFALARVLGAQVKHLHAYGSAGLQLRDTVVKFFELASSLLDKKVQPGEFMEEELERRRSAMDRRSTSLRAAFEKAGGRYDAELLSGAPGEDIKDAVRLFAADIVTFGRHKGLHTQPFARGQMPFYRMLEQDAIILVVPKDGESLWRSLA